MDKRLKNVHQINLVEEFFRRFTLMLKKCNVSDAYIEKAIQLISLKDNKFGEVGMGRSKKCISLKENTTIFFDYLENMAKQMGVEKFKKFLEASIDNIEQSFIYRQEREKDSTPNTKTSKTNFINLFLREIIIQNPQDVKLELIINPGETKFELTIGGVYIARMEFEVFDHMKDVQFTDFRVIPGLEGLSLGSCIFYEFCNMVKENYPDYTASAFNVYFGRDAAKIYSHWGAFPVIEIADKGEKIAYKPITQEEAEKIGKELTYLFPKEVVREHAQRQSKKYLLTEDSKVYSIT